MTDMDGHEDSLIEERAARREAESRVRELERKLAESNGDADGGPESFVDVMEHAGDLIQCTDLDGRYLYANKTWLERLGYNEEMVGELTLFDIVPPEHHELCERVFEQVADGYCVGPVEMSFQTKSGERVLVEGVLNGRLDAEPVWIRGIFRDIEARHHTERAKKQFVSSFSKKLRSPLESIREAVDSLDDSVAQRLSDKAQYLLDLADQRHSALDRMLEEIFEFEKLRTGLVSLDLDEMDLVGVVRQVVESRQKMAQHFGVRLNFESRLEQAIVFGDRDRLATALDHVLKLALTASRRNGVVEVVLESEGDRARLTVIDEGPLEREVSSDLDSLTLVSRGIDDERGWQATGLEYSVAGSIIEAHGGGLSVQRVNDRVVASVELSLAETSVERSDEERPRVLVCEDDEVCARLLKRLLKAGGYDVDIAATAAEAQAMLSERDYAAMTLDLVLPDRDGADLLHEIRRERDDIPVVVVSASADEGRESLSGDAANVVDWLNKPFEVDPLRRAIQNAVDRSSRELPRILHVEDDPDFQGTISSVLDGVADVSQVTTLAGARSELQQHEDFDLVLLDLVLPDGLGAELLPFLNRPKGKPIPVVIISSGDANDALGAHVSATLNKSQTTEEQLFETISAHLDRSTARPRS